MKCLLRLVEEGIGHEMRLGSWDCVWSHRGGEKINKKIRNRAKYIFNLLSQ